MRRLFAITLLFTAACRGEKVGPGESELRLSPPLVELGNVFVGTTARANFEIFNAGRAPLNLSWSVSQPDFALESAPGRIEGGTALQLTALGPVAALGPLEVVLGVTSEVGGAEARLRFTGVERPPCVALGPCVTAQFDDAEDRCVETPVADGTLCASACLEVASCQAGRCVGPEKSCDDQDACTLDLCREGDGCAHLPMPPCPGDGRCRVGVCNPARGCELAPAPDGVVCGRSGCTVADVCIAGACVERDPPDGFVCAEKSPCQGEGHCVADVCARPPATVLAPSWNAVELLPDAGPPPESWSDVLLSPTEDIALSSYFVSPPRLAAQSAAPVDLTTSARRCIYVDELFICADHPSDVAAGVSAVDPATGAARWTYVSILEDLPALAAADHHTFLARLMRVSSARVAAVYETRRVTADGQDTQCRSFSVVVLDRLGARIDAWTLSDPLFSSCVHPHSYGAATDAAGNLYFAFTASVQTSPASPAVGDTLFASYTPDGQLRWKAAESNLPGGELAVARGQVVHQHSSRVLSAATGLPLGVLASDFRLGVATRDALIPGPLEGGSTLEAFGVPGFAPAWSSPLTAGHSFASDQLRLAAWTTRSGARTVALAFDRQGPQLSLVAIDAATGQPAFSCPLALPAAPLLAEVGHAGLAAMTPLTSPPPCAQCDPRYALTQSRFFWVPLPLIDRPTEPWPGQLGGAGHDHQEDAVP